MFYVVDVWWLSDFSPHEWLQAERGPACVLLFPQYIAQGLRHELNKSQKRLNGLVIPSFSRWEIWGSETLNALPEIKQLVRVHLGSVHVLSLNTTWLHRTKGTISSIEGKLQGCLKPESFVKVECFHFDRRTRELPKYFLLTYLAIIHLPPFPNPITNCFCLENSVIVYHSVCGSVFKDVLWWNRNLRKHAHRKTER